MNWLYYMDKKQTKISPEILDVDSSRKPISLDGKRNHTKTRVNFFFEVTIIFFYFLFVLFFSSFLFI